MEDGRYLIFYTFPEESAKVDAQARSEASGTGEPRRDEKRVEAVAQAEEERRV